MIIYVNLFIAVMEVTDFFWEGTHSEGRKLQHDPLDRPLYFYRARFWGL